MSGRHPASPGSSTGAEGRTGPGESRDVRPPTSTFALTTLTLAMAAMGPENPLPPMGGTEVHSLGLDAVPEALREGVGRHPRAGLLPYTTQDGYTREVGPTPLPAVVLENEYLRAVVLPTLGGRLWSLEDRVRGRELLYQPPVVHVGNLALRNAWFAGGVEWNIGTVGHSPHTCSTVFSGRVDDTAGHPVLRLWELERLREVWWQVDIALPPGARALVVTVTIDNPNPWTVPMYWWSNSAVPLGDDTRVLSPSDAAYRFDYRGLSEQDWPVIDGQDRSYPGRGATPMDYFLRPTGRTQPWIASVDGSGAGMFQTSTALLQGRKLFQWGRGPSGRTWQEFLSGPGHEYLEVQAGLAATQLEHLALGAGERWSWTEAYGPLVLRPEDAHGAPSTSAAAAERAITAAVGPADLDRWHRLGCARADLPVTEQLTSGAGWGALHRMLLDSIDGAEGAARQRPVAPWRGTPDELGQEQAVHLALLTHDSAPVPVDPAAPVHYAPGPGWLPVLRAAAQAATPVVPAWWTHLQLGALALNRPDAATARTEWLLSVQAQDNGWARRDLARLDAADGDLEAASGHYLVACGLLPALDALRVEAVPVLLGAGRVEEAEAVLAPLLSPRATPRATLLRALVQRARGDRAAVLALLESEFVLVDVREGETTLAELWEWAHSDDGTPLPRRLDFSLTG